MTTSTQFQIRVKLSGFSAVCLFAIAWAVFYFQQKLGLAPCPWCVVQRGLFFLAALHGAILAFRPTAKTFWLLVWPLLGLIVSGYHVWLQNQPDTSLVCMEGWNFNRGLTSGLAQLWTPSGSCSDVSWVLLGQGIPFWTGVLWAILAGFVFYVAQVQQRLSGQRNGDRLK